jgi:hypothetical protein
LLGGLLDRSGGLSYGKKLRCACLTVNTYE